MPKYVHVTETKNKCLFVKQFLFKIDIHILLNLKEIEKCYVIKYFISRWVHFVNYKSIVYSDYVTSSENEWHWAENKPVLLSHSRKLKSIVLKEMYHWLPLCVGTRIITGHYLTISNAIYTLTLFLNIDRLLWLSNCLLLTNVFRFLSKKHLIFFNAYSSRNALLQFFESS